MNLNAPRCRQNTRKHSLDDEAPRDIVEGVLEESRRYFLHDVVEGAVR
jgi:hypothetical protein